MLITHRGRLINLDEQYAIEMLNITKIFPGIVANDNITLRLKKGEDPLRAARTLVADYAAGLEG